MTFARCVWMGAIIALWLLTGTAQGVERSSRIGALSEETMLSTPDPNRNRLVWWMPQEYWEAVLSEESTPASEKAASLQPIRPYIILGVADGAIGAYGGISYRSKAEIERDVSVKDAQAKLVRPYPEDQVNADAKSLLAIMKPILENTIGEMGKNMHFFFFPVQDEKGQPIVDAKKEGVFVVMVGQEEFRWRLPLGALLPPKACPQCGEVLSGAYQFCPWDGTRLKEGGGT